jgi:signal transduction histidine kinase
LSDRKSWRLGAVNLATSSRLPIPRPPISPPKLGLAFGNLNVRPKLMVLHNLFFLVLAASVYLSLIPLFEDRVAAAKARELSLLTKLFLEDQPFSVPGLEVYDFKEGTSAALAIPPEALTWLELHPGQIYNDRTNGLLYRLVPPTGQFRRIQAPNAFYDSVVERAKVTIFLVLGILYTLAIILLELLIMPRYVYGPIQKFLDADAAIHQGDRQKELIPEREILRDEIGRIMLSRNATVSELRKQEQELADAMAALEATAAELTEKNQQLEAAKQRLEEQDRLASLGLLSASVAHELNTPLAVLLGSIEKLSETVDSPPAQERLSRMRRGAQRLKRISESLVDFARARRDVFEPVAVRPLVDEAWGLVAIDEKASDVVFTNRVSPETRVTGNADRLIQVFVNLLRNSLNAVDSQGQIVASARPVQEGGRQWVGLTFEDNGPGIPPDMLSDIFEAFVTTRLDARGTGLGLTVAEGIVTQHGGAIAAANRPGGGALLEVKLPAA